MKKILIVDNNLMIQVKQRLENSGYEVISASDGITGLHRVNNENPDLIILDLSFSRMDGYQVCSILKRDMRFQNIPIIILSDRSNEDIAGGFGSAENKPEFYFRKPFNYEDFLAKINELIVLSEKKKKELHKRLSDEDARWMKHYIPGIGIEKYERA